MEKPVNDMIYCLQMGILRLNMYPEVHKQDFVSLDQDMFPTHGSLNVWHLREGKRDSKWADTNEKESNMLDWKYDACSMDIPKKPLV